MTREDHAEMSAKIDRLNDAISDLLAQVGDLERELESMREENNEANNAINQAHEDAKEEQINDIVERLNRGDTLEEACIYVAEKEQLDTYLRNAISNNKKGTQ